MNNFKKKPQNQILIKLDVWKAVGIVTTALLTTAVVTAFALVRVLNSDHFITLSNSSRIEAMEVVMVPRIEIETGFVSLENRLNRIETKLDRLIERK